MTETPEPTWLLISGSADATPAMIEYARRTVQRAIEKGWFILVGDNPRGVDLTVLETCQKLGNNRYAIAHLKGEPARSVRALAGKEVRSQGQYPQYHARDLAMADLCDVGSFIWNGKRKGTKAVQDYFCDMLRRETYLVDFTDGKGRVLSAKSRPPRPVQLSLNFASHSRLPTRAHAVRKHEGHR